MNVMDADTRPMLEETADSITKAMQSYGVTAQEAFDSLAQYVEVERAFLRKYYPAAFGADGKLRRDWWLIVYGDMLPWWRRWQLRFLLLWQVDNGR